jgi:3',5'-cyclic AMP phosphodiesterase CpdA
MAALAALVVALAAQPAHAAPPTLAAAGDIACAPADNAPTPGGCQQAATAALVRQLAPTAVAPLGDLQYESGELAEFAGSFEQSWGAFKGQMYPAPGNHEYYTNGATGYFDYFNGVGAATGAAGPRGKGYYAYVLGGWHVIVLNSNCDRISCAAGSEQEQWLRAELARYQAPCTLAYWHHPLFTSGPNRNDPNDLATAPLWDALYAAGADAVLNGHDHHYERFAPQDPAGNRDEDDGIREFVVGTGGRSLYDFQRRSPHSQFRDKANFGALQVTLRPGGYEWRFFTTGGAVLDSGSGVCHNVAPELAAVTITHRAFAVARVPTAVSARRPPYGSTISYTLSKPASVSIDIARLAPGRRSGGRCVAPRQRLSRNPRCTRAIRQGALERQGQAGSNKLFFTGRIGSRPLAPGSYRMTVVATAGGKPSRTRSVTFRVMKA